MGILLDHLRLREWLKFYWRVIVIAGKKLAKKLISFHMKNSHFVAIEIIPTWGKLIWSQRKITSSLNSLKYHHLGQNRLRKSNKLFHKHSGHHLSLTNIQIINPCINLSRMNRSIIKIYRQNSFPDENGSPEF